MIHIYMDHNVQTAITSGLRDRGIDVLTAQEDGRDRASDPELLMRATALNRLLFTHDDDLLAEAHRRQRVGEHFRAVAYAHQLRITIRQAIDDLELLSQAHEPSDLIQQVFHLPL